MFDLLYRDSDLVLGTWTCVCPAPGWSAPEEVRAHEIVVPLRGRWVRRRRGVERVGNANVVLFANPGDAYRIRHSGGEGDVSAVIFLEEGALGDVARAANGLPGPGRGSSFGLDAGTLDSGAFLALCGLIRRLKDGEPETLEVEELLGEVVGAALRGGRPAWGEEPSAATVRRHEGAVLRAEEFMAARYREPLSLGDVAGAAAYSPFHFARIFRARVGTSVHRYLTRLRLRKAVDAILEGETDLGRLALRLGFSSHSHFGQAFRREYGQPPSRVRAAGGLPRHSGE